MSTPQTIEKVILGVDPGTVVMGYSVVHVVKGETKPLVMDVIKFNTKLDHYTRLAKIFEELSKIVTLYTLQTKWPLKRLSLVRMCSPC